MPKHEILRSNEHLESKAKSEVKPVDSSLSMDTIENLYKLRTKQLESIKNHIYLKFYYQIEEKIKKEQQILKDILDSKLGRKKALEQYSFVLDPQYFEQKFFKLE